MSETTTLAPGTFAWVDLHTPDPAEARRFYSGLFGWEFEDLPTGGEPYSIARVQGKDVAATHKLSEQQRGRGVPPHWSSYVLVTSADESAARIEAAGGVILMPPFDVMTAGRMAVAQDPTGAVFNVWEAREHRGAALFNVPGALCWNELLTLDPDRAREFYTRVFGWGTETMDMQPGEVYTVFKNGDRPNGGMMRLPEEARKMGAPPNWLVYFAVADCEATFEKAASMGAQPFMPPTDYPGIGRGALMADPTGAAFAIIQLNA